MDKLQLEIKNLEIGYVNKQHEISVFKNINASFTNGQLIGLVGNNGIGKSTLLRTIASLQQKLSGDILINNNSIEKLRKEETAKLISIVLTEKISGFNLTVTDLISMGRVPYTNSFHELQENDFIIINECIQLCGLTDHKNKLLAELSDGLFQKAMIAKGLAQQTNLILLDEPTAYLDFNSKQELFTLLNNLVVKNNKCIIASSHDIELLLKYSTHLLVFGDNNEFEFIETNGCRSNKLFQKVTKNYFD